MGEPEKEVKEKKSPKKPKTEATEEKKEPKKEKVKVEREKLRLVGTDLDGHRTVVYALTDIKGIGARTAQVIADLAQVPKNEKIGNIPEAKIEELEEIIKAIQETAPSWIVNRQSDWDSGLDLHITGHEVEITMRNDINRLKMIRCYKGIRHERGAKVRGQRTRSNGRRGLTVGVVKKVARAMMKEKAKKEKTKSE